LTIEGTLINTARKEVKDINYPIPDVYAYIQNRVNVSRNTVYEVLKQSGRYNELAINPQSFLDKVVVAIRNTLNVLLVDGIKYHKINGYCYEMSLLHDEEIETYLDNLLAVSNDKQDKTPFNYYSVDNANSPANVKQKKVLSFSSNYHGILKSPPP
jgi:type III restriction enzyme